MWRNRSCLPDSLVFHDNYLGKDQITITLNFSKGGRAGAKTLAATRHRQRAPRALHSPAWVPATAVAIRSCSSRRPALRPRPTKAAKPAPQNQTPHKTNPRQAR